MADWLEDGREEDNLERRVDELDEDLRNWELRYAECWQKAENTGSVWCRRQGPTKAVAPNGGVLITFI